MATEERNGDENIVNVVEDGSKINDEANAEKNNSVQTDDNARLSNNSNHLQIDNGNMSEERFRIDRKKLEHMLLAGVEQDSKTAEEFFLKIGEVTRTCISWPSKLKIGAKSKKDPHIKVVGEPENINQAKEMIMSVLDTKTSRVTLKMDVSFTDHSHIIGKGGSCIKRVMQDTSCHIHFPDSNRTSSEKSNQVSIAGPPFGVETARRHIRELLPIVLMFEVPSNTLMIPDASSPAIQDISQIYRVSISFKQRPRTYGFIATVRGLHSDPGAVKNCILKVLEYLTGTMPVTVPVTTQIEIDPKHHTFMIGRNGCNIQQIMQGTGASIGFPDASTGQSRRSTVSITGTIESTITAKVQLMECLPLVLMFDVKDGETAITTAETLHVNHLMEKLDLLISVKLKPRQESKAIIIKSIERNATNIYIARQQILGENSDLYAFHVIPLPTLPISNNHLGNTTFNLPPNPMSNIAICNNTQRNCMPLIRQGDPRPLANQSPVMRGNNSVDRLSAPTNHDLGSSHSSSEGELSNSGTIGAEIRNARRQKQDAYSRNITHSPNENQLSSLLQPAGTMNQMTGNTNGDHNASLGNSWATRSSNLNNHDTQQNMHRSSPMNSTDMQSNDVNNDVNLSSSMSLTASLMDRLVEQQKKCAADYEMKKMLASKAMHSRVTFGEVRTPTDTWSGLGFSKSMPEQALKDAWIEKGRKLHSMKPLIDNLNAGLNSSGSSMSSTESTESESINETSLRRSTQGPPPGLEMTKSSGESAAAILTNNNEYVSMLSSNEPSVGALATVTDLTDLFSKLGLSKYTDTFQEQEVDLLTFMSLTEEDLRELGVAKFGARRRMVMAIQDLQKIHNFPSLSSAPSPSQQTLSDSVSLLPARHTLLDIANQSLRW